MFQPLEIGGTTEVKKWRLHLFKQLSPQKLRWGNQGEEVWMPHDVYQVKELIKMTSCF